MKLKLNTKDETELDKECGKEASTRKKMTCKNKIKEGTKEPPNCFLSIPILNEQVRFIKCTKKTLPVVLCYR